MFYFSPVRVSSELVLSWVLIIQVIMFVLYTTKEQIIWKNEGNTKWIWDLHFEYVDLQDSLGERVVVYTYVSIYVHMCVCVCVCVCMYVCTYICNICVCNVCMDVRTSILMHLCVCVCSYLYTYIYLYMYVYIYIYIYMLLPSLSIWE